MTIGRLKLINRLRDEAIGLFKRHWLCFAGITAFFAVPILLINKYFWRNQELVLRIINKMSINSFAVLDYAIYCILLIFFFWTLAALILAISKADRGGNPDVISSYSQALRILDSYLWVKILFVFKIFCWSLLLVIPGIIFGVLYNFAGMAIAVDGKKGKEAFVFSKEIIGTNLYDYLYCTIPVLAFLALFCAGFILYLDILIAYFSLIGNTFLAKGIDFLEIGLVAMTALFFLIFYYFLYKTLRDKKKNA
jgi:hypothetical protein